MKSSALAAAAILLLPAFADGESKESCPLGPGGMRSALEARAAVARNLSIASEAVAGARRRSVQPPAAPTFVYPVSVNFVDTEIFGKMKKDGIAAAPLASDEEFLRRVTLDLTGQIPDSATTLAFLGDTAADKRTKKIDQLLASDAFVDRWTMWLGDLVQNVQFAANSREYYQGRNAYYTYLRESLRTGKAYDQIVRELIAGTGDNFMSGTSNYWVRQIQANGPVQDTYDNLAAHSGEKFLGMPMLCLSCHSGLGHLEQVNTYLKSKTRGDFWGMAAFFAKTRAQRSADVTPNTFKYDVQDNNLNGAYQLNTVSGNKTPRQPVNNSSTYPPAFVLTGETPRTGENLRSAYGRMITGHVQFSRATVNYLWREMFGMAIVEPPDNMDLSKLGTQATHPNLLELLTNEFIADKYDLRAILRTMAVSNAYQLSTQYTAATWSESNTTYFARHLAHRLPAEQLLDAIVRATNVPVSFQVNGLGTVTSAMKLPDPLEGLRNVNGRFLDEFGRGDRDDNPRSNDTSISQSLALMNDFTVVLTRIRRSTANSTVAKVLASTTDPASIVDQLYVATLSRHPTTAERTQAVSFLGAGTLSQRTEDLQWALLNSLEFIFD